MEISIQSISDSLIRFVSEAPKQQILGAKLGAQLKADYPTFSPSQFQSRNLRQFIRTYVPQVLEAGRSGPDFVYALALATTCSDSISNDSLFGSRAPQTTFDWKAFSNPSYRFVLAANRKSGEFQTRTEGATAVEPWVILPKPNSDDHLQIAREFVQSLSEPTRTALSEVLASPMWFTNFTSHARQFGVASGWASFRTAKLRERFDNAISELQIPAPVRTIPSIEFTAPQTSSRLAGAPREQQSNSLPRDAAFRRLIQLVIADMPLNELRDLSLPIGKVFDHIEEITK